MSKTIRYSAADLSISEARAELAQLYVARKHRKVVVARRALRKAMADREALATHEIRQGKGWRLGGLEALLILVGVVQVSLPLVAVMGS